jgi:hypothetical protein
MKTNKIRLYFFIFLLSILSVLIQYQSYAQNETGVRYLNDTTFKEAGFWYDSTNSMFQNQFPIIRSIPPLSMNMPFDIMLSYIYLDSLLRFTTNYQQDSILQSMETINDTLTNTIKYLYKMVDYNPIIFNQYSGETALNNISVNGGRFRASLYNLRNSVVSKFKSLVNPLQKEAYFSLLYSDYILKIQVISIDSTFDKRLLEGIDDLNTKRYKVNAMVLDTIKGKIFIDNNQIVPSLFKQTKFTNILTPTPPIISFQYINRCYYQHPTSNIQNDFEFMNSTSGFKMQPGQTAVVFLTFTNQLFDFENDYFDLDVESLCSNNALPIINGNVRDINFFWSQNQIQSYESWKLIVLQLIQNIQTSTY